MLCLHILIPGALKTKVCSGPLNILYFTKSLPLHCTLTQGALYQFIIWMFLLVVILIFLIIIFFFLLSVLDPGKARGHQERTLLGECSRAYPFTVRWMNGLMDGWNTGFTNKRNLMFCGFTTFVFNTQHRKL